MSYLSRLEHRFTKRAVALSLLLTGCRVIHSASKGDLRVRVYRAPATLFATREQVIVEAPFALGRWKPVAVLEPEDVRSAAELLAGTYEWYRNQEEHR